MHILQKVLHNWVKGQVRSGQEDLQESLSLNKSDLTCSATGFSESLLPSTEGESWNPED